MKKIVIIGAGAMGSAFSIPCADNSNEVFLVGSFLEDKIIPGIEKEVKKEMTLREDLDEDKVKGSNVRKKKSGSGYEVLSGKTGKPLNKTFKSKKSAQDFIKAYHANVSERIFKELRG